MDMSELVKKVNASMDNLDLISARRLIEENIDLINENRHHLRSNARSMFDIVKNNTESVINTLNRKEMNVIYSINAYATKFDIRGLKLSIKNNPELLVRKDIQHYLNEDAKTILTGMKVISINE
ncbi:hypothetical protein FG384_05425 [Psychrobacillus vulpis]|uniref:Uncharacterized protein n=2 Tax=Psychrobacillus vulpis TaxID=2325572 RepID=A0A544TUB3_9BACI|nr:hypothetical protein FG384_05425 [Psychrobacillus vulpis]